MDRIICHWPLAIKTFRLPAVRCLLSAVSPFPLPGKNPGRNRKKSVLYSKQQENYHSAQLPRIAG
jgi:hypothetical protein